jgi:molecular chaperone DnaJ
MPHLRSGVRGDLHAHIDVVVPTRLETSDAELLRKFKENRTRDIASVRTAQGTAGSGGGLFSRLRETFSGR